MRGHDIQLLAKFYPNPMKRLEIIGKKRDFWTLIPLNPGIKIFFKKNKNVTLPNLLIYNFMQKIRKIQ